MDRSKVKCTGRCNNDLDAMRCHGAQDIGGQLVDALNLPGLRVGSVTGEVRSREGRCAREARDGRADQISAFSAAKQFRQAPVAVHHIFLRLHHDLDSL
jgi:hypothetical protein